MNSNVADGMLNVSPQEGGFASGQMAQPAMLTRAKEFGFHIVHIRTDDVRLGVCPPCLLCCSKLGSDNDLFVGVLLETEVPRHGIHEAHGAPAEPWS